MPVHLFSFAGGGRIVWVELMGHVETMCSKFWRMARPLSKATVPFTSPPVVRRVQFLCILTDSCHCPSLSPSPSCCDMVSDYEFSLPLSVTNNSKHIFMFLEATCSFSLERCLKLFAHFQSGLFVFLLL